MIMRLNEQPDQVDGKSTFAEVIEGLEIPRCGYVLKGNGTLVPRNFHDDHHLATNLDEKESF